MSQSEPEQTPSFRKRSHPGKQCVRGQGVLYDEPKERINLSLTSTSIYRLTELATIANLSRSELLEQLLRDDINYDLLNKLAIRVKSPENYLSAYALAKRLGVEAYALNKAANQGKEYFRQWSAQKGKGTYDFEILHTEELPHKKFYRVN